MAFTRVKKILNNPLIPFSYLWVSLSPIIKSSQMWLRVYYRLRTKKRLNLVSPSSFQEKTQWLKLHYTDPLFTRLVDKYEVRKYVAERVGDEYLIPLLGVYDRFDDIDFDLLPDQFVLKPTHDSGGIVICKDKACFNKRKAKRKLNRSLRHNYFFQGREYPYRDVKPRIVAEQYMSDGISKQLPDYKFFCFNGKPEILFMAEGRFSKEGARFTFYDMNWKVLPIYAKGHLGNGLQSIAKRPGCFEEMKVLVQKLCLEIPFVRIDVYDVDGRVYFGEFTFFHDGGVVEFEPDEWNYRLGDMINLPTDIQNQSHATIS